MAPAASGCRSMGKGREVMIAIACPHQAVESSAPAQGHADVGVLVGNVYFWHMDHALVQGCQA